MQLVTGSEMRAVDQRAIAECGIPGLLLMENAGHMAARAAVELLGEVGHKRIQVVCGTGNNGGDGLVAARHLQEMGAEVTAFLVGEPHRLQGDAATMLQAWLGRGATVHPLPPELTGADLIIDALLGTGAKGPPRSPAREAIAKMNRAGAPVLALDMPSGVDADGGQVWEEAVQAAMTVTFALPKLGLFLHPGSACAGRVVVAPITLPPTALPVARSALLEVGEIQALLPYRARNAHKGKHGRIMVIGGSVGMGGAITLTARAALRAGAGLVTAAVPGPVQPQVAASLPEAMTLPLAADEEGRLAESALPQLLEAAGRMDAVAIGPGLGRSPAVERVVRELLTHCPLPAVVDADALPAMSPGLRLGQVILTPHPGEAAALLGCPVAQVEQDRVTAVRTLAHRFQSVVVLKGAGTLVAEPGGMLHVEVSRNPLLATGGTGDVLTGVIAAWLGQGCEASLAARGGVHLHARAGWLLSQKYGYAGLLAHELADHVPLAREYVARWKAHSSQWLWDAHHW